jgi:hypothetical protein
MDANGVSMDDNDVSNQSLSTQEQFIRDLTELLRQYNSNRGHEVLALKMKIEEPSKSAEYVWMHNELFVAGCFRRLKCILK